MNIDNLTGPALDAAIAERLFGLEVEERTNVKTRKHYWACRKSGSDWTLPAYFSRRMGPLLAVEYELHKRGWTRTEPHDRATGNVRIVLEHTDGRTVEAFGRVNEALCRAALKAVTS